MKPRLFQPGEKGKEAIKFLESVRELTEEEYTIIKEIQQKETKRLKEIYKRFGLYEE